MEQQIKELKAENEQSTEELKNYKFSDELYRGVIQDINLTVEEKEKENKRLELQNQNLIKKIQGYDSDSWAFDVGESGTYKSMAKVWKITTVDYIQSNRGWSI